MNPRRLHSDTIFSINSLVFGSAIRRESFLEPLAAVKGRQSAGVKSRALAHSWFGRQTHTLPADRSFAAPLPGPTAIEFRSADFNPPRSRPAKTAGSGPKSA